MLDGESIQLESGHYGRPVAPDSSSLDRVWVHEGSAVHGDFDGDQDDDVALVLVDDPGGSGTFSYLAVAMQAKGRYQGSDALFLGDRIRTPVITINDGVIRARFLDRPDDTPYGDPPTHARIVEARLMGLHLKQVSPAPIEP